MPWQNSSETQLLALFRGKVLCQTFWPQLEHSPLLPLSLPKPHTLGMAPRHVSATSEYPSTGQPAGLLKMSPSVLVDIQSFLLSPNTPHLS